MSYRSASAEQTADLGCRLGKRLTGGELVFLKGPLGTGKTVFARGLAEALGVIEPVTSPTFTIVNEYPTVPPLLHIDLYRISGPEEFLLLGVDEQFGDSVTLVEWPERAEGALENPDFVVEITICSTGERTISILPDPELNP